MSPPRKHENTLTAERLRELVDYDPKTGVFIRKVDASFQYRAGSRADTCRAKGRLAGYCRVSIDGQRHLAHRLAWLYAYGVWPKHQVDHINGDPSDNRLCNLRDVPNGLNQQNQRKTPSNNRAGYLGVREYKQGRWQSNISVGGKKLHLGTFTTPEAAYDAYVTAKRLHHPGCSI
jgi:hypothetical protein